MDQVRALLSQVPPEAFQVLLVLGLSFLLGLERGGRKARTGHYMFGGVRTFPLIGLLGYGTALVSGTELLLVALGLGAVTAFMVVSYRHKLETAEDAGVTTEISGLLTYVLGALVHYTHYWIATTIVVLALLLLELKSGLENLSDRIPAEEVETFTKFLLLTAVILPAVPNQDLGPFRLNPFKAWLVVVAVSGVSYGAYVLQRVTHKRGGIVLAALLGGAYSSTVITVVLARRAKHEDRPHLFSGSILAASGMMFLRLVLLLAIFSQPLYGALALKLLILGLAATAAGLWWTHRPDPNPSVPERQYQAKNPLELRSTFAFAGIFIALLVVTTLVLRHFGSLGMYALAVLMGAVNVDPFIMGLAQTAGSSTPLATAAAAVLITTAANNVLKGVYAFIFADRQTGVQGLVALVLLGLAGLSLVWL
ncbi:MAG: MgtC/SapB family protein [Thermoanaerobaculaceae bacterium]|nr:MgtC/SapB family protein [Thermoanaerobaculaceae bacterium]MDI9620544.1 MgtC/SapB family protein [Acidobacteriota bacterium]NLH11935.1 MgtC/SapB family protein [Holophagae bacterium]HPW55217.1 MgtC/SapB family protein [Thermoanaerobaculaceae bacterium]